MLLSVIIPTRNPDPARLAEVLQGLHRQSVPKSRWEILIVDNGSSSPISVEMPPGGPTLRVVSEPRPGLLHARLRGMRETTAPVLLFIDDDTVPDDNVLASIIDAFATEPRLAVTGGKILPRWLAPPPPWIHAVAWALALRDNGPTPLRWRYRPGAPIPGWTPIGAGMALRRDALAPYFAHVAAHESEIIKRSWKGQGQGGNEDKDIVCCLLKAGWDVGYEPEFVLQHIIPAERLTRSYFLRLIPGLQEMWMRTLHAHGMNPWPCIHPATVPLRKAKAWFSFRAWSGIEQHFNWISSCGSLDGLARAYSEKPYTTQ